MRPPRICVSSISFSKSSVLRAEISALFGDVRFNDSGTRMTEEEVISFARGFDGMVVGLEPVSARVIDELPEVSIFAKYGVGLDNIDLPYLKKVGRVLGWIPGVNRRSVSEIALLMMLNLARNTARTSLHLKQGQWVKDGGRELSGMTIGIVGCGFVGEDLLGLLRPFGGRRLICDLLDKSEVAQSFGAQQVAYDFLLSESDIISFHVPLSESTRAMLGRSEIAMLKKGAIVINTARGPILDQAALREALLAGKIQAGLDVFEEEPATDMDFLSLPGLYPTPHIGGNSREAVLAMGRAAISTLRDHFSISTG